MTFISFIIIIFIYLSEMSLTYNLTFLILSELNWTADPVQFTVQFRLDGISAIWTRLYCKL